MTNTTDIDQQRAKFREINGKRFSGLTDAEWKKFVFSQGCRDGDEELLDGTRGFRINDDDVFVVSSHRDGDFLTYYLPNGKSQQFGLVGRVVDQVAGVPIKARVILGDGVNGAELLGQFATLDGGKVLSLGSTKYAIVLTFDTSNPGDPVTRAMRVRRLKQQKADLDAKISAAERGVFQG